MTAGRVTADSSVVVPALLDWHENHARSRDAMREVERLPAHVILETIAVMTRLPGGLAAPSPQVGSALREWFPSDVLALSPGDHSTLVETVERRALRGGQVYDALVGATAAAAGYTLLSRDRRAEPTCRAVDAQVSPLA